MKTEGMLKKFILLSYSTEHLLKKDKVRFFYALNGRTSEGIIPRTKTKRIGRSVLLISPKYVEDYRGFLRYWKCDWKELNIFTK
jgi:hypothetical protein